MDNVTFRRRNRLKKHFVITSNVLLFGYSPVSDSAKITFQVIDSFDWQDGQGLRKGFAYPSVDHLAAIRSVSDRTIQRHMDKLVTPRGSAVELRTFNPGRLGGIPSVPPSMRPLTP